MPRSAKAWTSIDVGLRKGDVACVDREATAMGLSRSRWIAGLVHHRVTGGPQFSREAELALIFARSELRRLRHELAMLRAGPVVHEQVLQAIRNLDESLQRQMDAIGAGFRGNLTYWEPVE